MSMPKSLPVSPVERRIPPTAPVSVADPIPVSEEAPASRARVHAYEAGPDAHQQHLRMLEALLFAATEPLDARALLPYFPSTADVPALLLELQENYRWRGVTLQRVAGKWIFRTAEDLAHLLAERRQEPKKLSRAALETLSIIAYHQPVTRAEIEDIRGVATSKGTLDVLLEIGWIRWRGRRRAPGRPLTYGTTDGFLSHFGLASLSDLPGLADLKGAGMLDAVIPAGFKLPDPMALASLTADELPLDDADHLGDGLGDDEGEARGAAGDDEE